MPRGVYVRTDGNKQSLSKALFGRKLSKEHCKNIGLGMLGCQRMLGKHQTEKQKAIVKIINSVIQKGKNNSNWKGGFRTSNPRVYNKEWRRTHRENVKANSHRRRGYGNVEVKVIQLVYEDNIKKYGTLTCYLCLKKIEFGKDHLEHKIPLSRGGNHKKENLDIACQKCNVKKHDKTEEEFRKVGQ